MTYVDGKAALGAVAPGPAKTTAFDPDRLKQKKPSLVSTIIGYVVDHPYLLYAFLRRFLPIIVFRNWAFISRYDDVIEVLRRQDVFNVPFGPKVEVLNAGPNFLLGMQDGPDYQAVHQVVVQAFPLSDNAAIVAPLAAVEAEAQLRACGGRIDAVKQLITLIPTRICDRYYGVAVPDETRFAHVTIAMSTFMFGDPGNNPAVREEALKAGEELRPIVDAAIAAARAGTGAGADTVVNRLVKMADGKGNPVADSEIRAILIGMITGFVPTNTMAGGHMLEMLLRRPDMMAAAQAAARAGDDELLKRCLWEAFRFMPLNPGPFRICGADAWVAQGTKRAKLIPKGTNMLVGTQSAMFDSRRVENPNAFEPDRNHKDQLTFGYGLHWCIGAGLAEAQITQTLKPLLKMKNLRRAPGPEGQLGKDGPFPAHLVVEFDA